MAQRNEALVLLPRLCLVVAATTAVQRGVLLWVQDALGLKSLGWLSVQWWLSPCC